MNKRRWIISVLFIILIIVGTLSVFVGPSKSLETSILLEIRLPRVLLGILVGMGLATAGVMLQGLLRNPLADPYVIGTSSGATLGALVATQLRQIFPNWVAFSTFTFYIIIFLFAFLATMSAYFLARSQKQVSIINLLLCGMIVSTFCGALILLFFVLQHKESFSVFLFLMGNLSEGHWPLIITSGVIIIVGIMLSLLFSRHLNILSLGEEKAQHLGIEVEKFKFLIFALVSLIVSAAVAISGAIGFVGLIVPHMTRFLTGPDHKILIPASALSGGILLILADDIARTAVQPIEIPVGVIMSMVGAPFFLWLLRKKRQSKYY